MLFEKLEKVRKSPRKARERVVSIVTIVCVGVITVVWFFFTVVSISDVFHEPQKRAEPPQQVPAGSGTASITPPFSR